MLATCSQLFPFSDASHGKPDSVEAVEHAEATLFETTQSAMEFTLVVLLLPLRLCHHYDTR